MPPLDGRYEGACGEWRLELRIDIEGASALDIISGDLWFGPAHLGKFVAKGHQRTATLLPLKHQLVFELSARLVQAELTMASGQSVSFPCRPVSPFFRDFILQPSVQSGLADHWFVDSFRILPLITDIYAQAGIGLTWRTPNTTSPVAANGWTESDLQEAMDTHRWMLLADQYQCRADLRGISFATESRRGCAVFLRPMGDESESGRRHGLFTCVHELGHILELPHALPAECSWMSVPARYPGGENRFFKHFEAKFLYQELRYLRHGVPTG